MIIIDLAKISLSWALALTGGVLVAAMLVSMSASKNAKSPGIAKSTAKLRKIHALGTSIPILGDMPEVVKHASVRHDWLTEQSRRFRFEPWQINIPGVPAMIVATDPAVFEAISTTQFDTFVKGAKHRYLLHDVFGDGIINSDGEQWYHQRKTAAKFFSAKTLRLMMVHTMKRNMQQMCDFLDSSKQANVDLTLLFHQFSLQTFLEVGVGVDFPLIGNTASLPFEEAMDESIKYIVRRRLLPPIWWKTERWLNIGKEKKIAEAMAIIHSQIETMIKHNLSESANKHGGEAPEDSEEKIRSAIDLFVEHSETDKAGLDPRNLVDFVINFVLAARDTSSVAMSWFFYALSKHPEVEAKIRSELATKLPSLGVTTGEYITADHVKQLVYLEAAIKESLRLYPSAPFFVRQATTDTVIDDDLFIHKGQAVAISIYAMARNPKVWGPDAAEFKPERWINPMTGGLISVSSSKFGTFSTGPRVCIGMNLAMLNLRVVIVNVLRRYTLEIDPQNDGSYVNAVTLIMKHPLVAKVRAY